MMDRAMMDREGTFTGNRGDMSLSAYAGDGGGVL